MLFHPLPDRERPAIRADGAGRVKRRNVWRRRWRRLPEQHLEHPLAAEHRIGPRRDRCFHEDAALTEQTAPVRALKRHAAETRADDAGNAVVVCQPLVRAGVVGVEQVEHAGVAPDDAVEEQLGLANQIALDRAVVGRILHRVGPHLGDVLQPQPLCGESRRQRERSRIGKHAAHLRLENGAVVQLPALGEFQQGAVGRLRPEEEGQARGKGTVADLIIPAGTHRCRLRF